MCSIMEALLKILAMHADIKTALVTKLRLIRPDSKLTISHINNWLYRDKAIPSEWVLPLSEAVNYEKTPHELRPDLYPHPDDGLPENMRSASNIQRCA